MEVAPRSKKGSIKLWSKIILDPNDFCPKTLGQKNHGPKKFWVKKNLGSRYYPDTIKRQSGHPPDTIQTTFGHLSDIQRTATKPSGNHQDTSRHSQDMLQTTFINPPDTHRTATKFKHVGSFPLIEARCGLLLVTWENKVNSWSWLVSASWSGVWQYPFLFIRYLCMNKVLVVPYPIHTNITSLTVQHLYRHTDIILDPNISR